jgi:WD40 repeat protein
VATRKLLGNFADGYRCTAFSPTGDVVAGTTGEGDKQNGAAFEVSSDKKLATLNPVPDMIVAVSEVAKILVCRDEEGLTVWDFTGKKKGELKGNLASPRAGRPPLVSITRDGKYLAAILDDDAGVVQVWDLGTTKGVATLRGPKRFASVALSPDGKYLAAGRGGAVFDNAGNLKLWDLSAVLGSK